MAPGGKPQNRKRAGKTPGKRGPKGPNSTSFKPGVSGNPGGRPKSVKEVQTLASRYSVEALETLVVVMRTARDPKEVRQAAVAILNRACGMPAQPLTGGGGDPLETEFPDLMGTLKKLAGEV